MKHHFRYRMRFVLGSCLTLAGLSAHAQNSQGTGGTGTVPSSNVGVIPGSTVPAPLPNEGAAVDARAMQNLNNQNARAAQSNSVQGNQGQAVQQGNGGGVFGPSRGPGIFGPTNQPVTTDIYGNQQPVSGTVQPSQGAVSGTGARGTQDVRTQNPISYDANGQPLPSTLYPASDVPQTLNPITTTNGTQNQNANSNSNLNSNQNQNQNQNQPVQQPAGTVTGR